MGDPCVPALMVLRRAKGSLTRELPGYAGDHYFSGSLTGAILVESPVSPVAKPPYGISSVK
jgi:hypothetical protein